jgi:hypothetical protein
MPASPDDGVSEARRVATRYHEVGHIAAAHMLGGIAAGDDRARRLELRLCHRVRAVSGEEYPTRTPRPSGCARHAACDSGREMDTPARARMQIRAVRVVWEVEARRWSGLPPDHRGEHLGQLRDRCLEVLADARAVLDGQAPWHADVLRELDAVRSEIENT